MQITFKHKPKTVVAIMSGEIDQHCADEARRLIEREFNYIKANNIVLDLSSVTFMDSSGIGMVMGRYKTVSALGGKMAILKPSREADRIFKISGLYRIVNSFEDLESALSSF